MYERWSTLHIAAPRRARFWREATEQAFVPLTPRIARADDFRALMIHRGLDSLALNEVRAPAHGVDRTPHDLARGGPDLMFFNLYLQGRAGIRQGGAQAQAASGQVLVFDGGSPFELDQPDATRLLSLAVPQSQLPRGLAGRRRPACLAAQPAAALLACQVRELASWPGEISSPEAAAAAQVLLGAVAAVLGGADAEPAGRRSLQGALRRLIERRYADPSLSAAAAAAELGVSVRTLHARCAAAGTTFGAALLQHRLARAHAMLRLAPAQTAILEVAARCGFASPAHFSRRFHERYGRPPRELRGG